MNVRCCKGRNAVFINHERSAVFIIHERSACTNVL